MKKNAQTSEISEIPTIDQSDWTCPRLVIVHGQPLVPGTWITVTSCKRTKMVSFLGGAKKKGADHAALYQPHERLMPNF